MKKEAKGPPGVTLYDFDDYDAQRNLMYDDIKSGFMEAFPAEYAGLRVELEDPGYDGPESFSIGDQKDAILRNKSLNRRLRGTMVLRDLETNEELDRKLVTLAKVPVLTERGTFIQNGNEIASIRQARLRPGPYSRRQDNGHLETQFPVRVGTGNSFRVGFEPDTAQYRFRVKSSNLHLYSLMKDLGYDDETLAQSWGEEILEMNKAKYDSRTLTKAYKKLVPAYAQDSKASDEVKKQAVRDALESVQVDKRVMQKHLPNYFDRDYRSVWRKQARQKDLFTKYATDKSAEFNLSEVRMIAEFLNENHDANIPTTAGKADMESYIVQFVQGSDINFGMLELGDQLQETQQKANENVSAPEWME